MTYQTCTSDDVASTHKSVTLSAFCLPHSLAEVKEVGVCHAPSAYRFHGMGIPSVCARQRECMCERDGRLCLCVCLCVCERVRV